MQSREALPEMVYEQKLGYGGDVRAEASVGESVSADGEEGDAEAEMPRQLIHNAELHLEVEACDEARRAIDAALAASGGYLASANVSHFEGRVSRAVLVLRIPSANLGDALETFSQLGTVLHESLSTQDITDEFYDVQARLSNARKLESRLQELLATEADDLKDMLEVERELARVRETIERFEGKLRLWSKQVAFSTVTLQLSTRDLYASEPTTLGEQIGRTLHNSWSALVEMGRGLLLVVVALLPWAIPLALLGWLFVRFLRRLAARSRARAATRAAARASLE